MGEDIVRIVLLTRDDYEHCYVANKLAAVHPLIAIVVDKGKPRTKLERVHVLLRRYTLRQLLSHVVSKAISTLCGDKERSQTEIFHVLGRENCEKHLHKDIIKYVCGLNTTAGFETIKNLQPDVILVYGTSVVSDKILSLAPKGAINMHTGISPYYRGAGCAFWPLYYEELHMLGATIHECTSKIDGGMIYEVGQAKLQSDDGLFSVFARCVEVGTGLYIKVVGDLLVGRLHGEKQQLELGREYRVAMKSWRQDWTVRRKIKRGLIRNYITQKVGIESGNSAK